MSGPCLKAADFKIAFRGSNADIRMSDAEHAAYLEAIEGNDKLSVQRRTHLHRFFKEFCNSDDYHRRLNDKQFKREGNFSVGNRAANHATIWVFKAWQWRLYGSVMRVDGRRCFVGVRVDPNKKQDKADPKILRAAAELIGALEEFKI
jgi:hypothetical protein